MVLTYHWSIPTTLPGGHQSYVVDAPERQYFQNKRLAPENCLYFDWRKYDTKGKDGRVRKRRCRYCWHSRKVPVHKDTVWECSGCETPVCVTCNVKYHRWLKFSHEASEN